MIGLTTIGVVIGAHKILGDKSECYLDEDEKRDIKNTPVIWTLHHNKGIACENLKDKPNLVKIMSAGSLAGLIACLMLQFKNKGGWVSRLGLSLMIGGGIANLADRLDDGEVTDYIQFKTDIPKIKKLVFNIADLAIIAGALIFIISKIVRSLKKD